MALIQRDFRKDKAKAVKAAQSVRHENINSSLLEFIPHLMRGRDRL